MKTLITILNILISTLVMSQDINHTTMSFLNEYRNNRGLNSLVWSKSINKKVKSHTQKLIEYNKGKKNVTIFHSLGHTKENVVSFSTNESNVIGWGGHEFYEFINKEFGLNKEDIDSTNYPALLTIYAWDGSPKHKEGMLDKGVKKGSVSLCNTTKTIKVNNSLFEYTQWFGTFMWE